MCHSKILYYESLSDITRLFYAGASNHNDFTQEILRSLFYHLDAQILYFNTFIIFLYMFRALLCSSSGGQIVLIQHLVSSLSLGDCSVNRLREERTLVACVLNGHLKRVTVSDAVLIQFVFLKISIIMFETCRGV